jgi:hypothetical protein
MIIIIITICILPLGFCLEICYWDIQLIGEVN